MLDYLSDGNQKNQVNTVGPGRDAQPALAYSVPINRR